MGTTNFINSEEYNSALALLTNHSNSLYPFEKNIIDFYLSMYSNKDSDIELEIDTYLKFVEIEERLATKSRNESARAHIGKNANPIAIIRGETEYSSYKYIEDSLRVHKALYEDEFTDFQTSLGILNYIHKNIQEAHDNYNVAGILKEYQQLNYKKKFLAYQYKLSKNKNQPPFKLKDIWRLNNSLILLFAIKAVNLKNHLCGINSGLDNPESQKSINEFITVYSEFLKLTAENEAFVENYYQNLEL